jgi:phospholipid transport system substrate-binding protein
MLLGFAPWVVASNNDPEAVVEPLFEARDAFYEDVNQFQAGSLTEAQLVERIANQFAPILDDRKVALRVMGRFARQASEDARVQFTERLESSLVDAYARGLAGYGGEQLVLPEAGIVLRPGRAMVEARLESPGKDALPIQFAMGYDADHGWRVENVVLAGINLGVTLRNQFADLVKSSGSIEGAIESWSFESVSTE